MPLNSIPSTVDVQSFEAKLKAIRKPRGRMFVDVAFWGGLVPQNAHNASILEDLLAHGVVGLKAFMSPAGTEDFDQSSVKDIKAAAASLSKFNAPLMVHAELPSENDVVSTNGKDPRKYSTYMNSRPRKWEKVCFFF
jgi:dihydroorotase-like cyclic amidohydrolase